MRNVTHEIREMYATPASSFTEEIVSYFVNILSFFDFETIADINNNIDYINSFPHRSFVGICPFPSTFVRENGERIYDASGSIEVSYNRMDPRLRILTDNDYVPLAKFYFSPRLRQNSIQLLQVHRQEPDVDIPHENPSVSDLVRMLST